MGLILSANPFLYLDQARYCLESTCDKVGGYTYNSSVSGQPNGTWSDELGYGRINADNAVDAAIATSVRVRFVQAATDDVLTENSIYYFNPKTPHSLKIIYPSSRVYSQGYTLIWFRNGIRVADGTNLYELNNPAPGQYKVLISNGCNGGQPIYSETVEIRYMCNDGNYSQLWASGITYSSNTTISHVSFEVYHVGADINVTAGKTLTLTNCRLVFDNCARIYLNNGASLIATNCEFVACDKWPGIFAENAGVIVNLTSCLIENATIGVATLHGGNFTSDVCEYGQNYQHICLQANDWLSPTATVSGNKFGFIFDASNIANACTHPFTGGTSNYDNYVEFHECSIVSMITSDFYSSVELPISRKGGVYAHGLTQSFVTGSEFHGEFAKGITIENGDHITCDYNILFSDQETFTFGTPYLGDVGIRISNVHTSTVTANQLHRANIGLEMYRDYTGSFSRNTVRYNAFENDEYGFISATKENPVTASYPYNNTTGLVDIGTECNLFSVCDYGWVGTGTYPDQGTSAISTGNTFNSITEWSTCVTDNSCNYWWLNANEDLYSNIGPALVLDGTTINSGNYFTNCFASNPSPSNANTCPGPNAAPLNTTQLEQTVSAFAYPNPFDNKIIIQFQFNISEKTNLTIYTVTGLKVLEIQNVIVSKEFVIDTKSIQTGVYIVEIKYADGITQKIKVIKTNN